MVFLNVREFVPNDCVHFLACEMAKQVVGKQNAAAGARVRIGHAALVGRQKINLLKLDAQLRRQKKSTIAEFAGGERIRRKLQEFTQAAAKENETSERQNAGNHAQKQTAVGKDCGDS